MASKRKEGKNGSGIEGAKKAKMDDMDWKVHDDSVLFKIPDKPQKRSKIAAFGVDNSLLFTKSANVTATDENDWRLYNESVPKTLQKLYKDGYKLVIFCNASSVKGAFGGKQAARVKGRLDKLIELLEVPVCVYVSTKVDKYHKPKTGMVDLCLKHSDIKSIDKKNSFCVGSAAGRVPNFGIPDKKFCEAAGLRYFTPEDLFGDMDYAGKDDIARGGEGGGKNPQLVNCFRTLANLFKDDDPAKRLKYRRVANAIEQYDEEITSGKQVEGLEGITRATVGLIDEWLENEEMSPIEQIMHPEGGDSKNKGKGKGRGGAQDDRLEEQDGDLEVDDYNEEDGDFEDEYVELV